MFFIQLKIIGQSIRIIFIHQKIFSFKKRFLKLLIFLSIHWKYENIVVKIRQTALLLINRDFGKQIY